ncbi:MAG: hypothetical protein RLZZ408_1659 [Verrucomicrobiota bacterium]|jgi:hypothetical protein
MTPFPPPPSGFSDRGSVTGNSVTADDGTMPGSCHHPAPDSKGFPGSGDSCDTSSLILGEKENDGFSLSLVGPAPFPTDPPRFIDYQLRMRRDDWWTYYRPTIIRRAGGSCERCGGKTRRLEVHHLTYERFGRELLTDLQGLCEPCHKIADEERKRFTRRRYWSMGEAEDRAEISWCEQKFGEDPGCWPDDAAERFQEWRERKEGRDMDRAVYRWH